MIIKRVITIVILAVFLFINVASIHAAPIISISNFDTDGSINTNMGHFTLNLDLKNSGDSCANAVTVSTNSIFLTNQDSDNGPTDICGTKTLDIILDIPPSTPAGTYPVSILGTYTDENNSKQYTFSQTINLYLNGNSYINAHIINSNPLDVYAGDTATISVLVENDGTSLAQSINGVLYANEPLEIKSAGSFFSVGSLQPKQSYTAEFSFEVPKNARSGIYPMNLALTYIENNQEKTKNIPLSFEIKKKATFETSDEGSDILYPKDSGKIIRIKVTNTGTEVAKEVKVQIQPQYPFTTDGSIRYITNLEPGSSSIVQFAIDIDKDATIGNYGTNMILDFKDSEGNELHDSVVTSLAIQNKSLLQILFVDYGYLWIIGLLIILFILIRISRRKQEK